MNTRPQQFEGTAPEMRESEWLASEDIEDAGDVTVEIEAVIKRTDVSFEAGRKKPVVYSLKFKGKTRELVLNGTNRRRMVEHFGKRAVDWKGQKITLYVDPNVKFAGKTVKGIRIR